ncbi:MAG TPA: hypothetical protein VKZ96_19965 [Thermomicrobiales bacterium]|nr:hypothetical protein [Thermomicrobiales bacterium]
MQARGGQRRSALPVAGQQVGDALEVAAVVVGEAPGSVAVSGTASGEDGEVVVAARGVQRRLPSR